MLTKWHSGTQHNRHGCLEIVLRGAGVVERSSDWNSGDPSSIPSTAIDCVAMDKCVVCSRAKEHTHRWPGSLKASLPPKILWFFTTVRCGGKKTDNDLPSHINSSSHLWVGNQPEWLVDWVDLTHTPALTRRPGCAALRQEPCELFCRLRSWAVNVPQRQISSCVFLL